MKTNIASTICIVVLLALVVGLPVYAEKSVLQDQFDQRFSEWFNAQKLWHVQHGFSSCLADVKEQRENLLALGLQTTPMYIAMFERQIQDPTWNPLDMTEAGRLFTALTGKLFPRDEYLPTRKYRSLVDLEKFVEWWHDGRVIALSTFDDLFAQWDGLDRAGQTRQATEASRKIWFLGVEALPLIMKKIRGGDVRLIPWIRPIVGSRVDWKTADLPTVLEWWENNKEKLTFPPIVEEKAAEEPVAATSK